MTKQRAFGLFSLISISLFFLIAAAGDPPLSVSIDEMVWEGIDFEAGTARGMSANEEGLQLDPSVAIGGYESPLIETAIPFNVAVPQWEATLPAGGTISIMMRTASDEDGWSEWAIIEENADWTLPGESVSVGNLVTAGAHGNLHTRLQFAIQISNLTSQEIAQLNSFKITLIDSISDFVPGTAAPAPASHAAESGYPKPAVVGRDVWCTDEDCNYSNGLQYVNVSHLIIHHTVTSNDSSDWMAIVRAIWSFHTYTRGWGDIGYNYLVDPNGVIYEGHHGGDDVVGTHAAGANAGSMGVALIGTFTDPHENPPGIEPPATMINSLTELLAWKADQKNIDVFGSSYLAGLGWGLPHLGGHRDAYGTTTCPGVQAHRHLPDYRQAVADKMGFVSPHIYIDNLDAEFTASNNGHWYDGPYNCGFNQHALLTYSVTDPAHSTNWGEWRPTIPEAGSYEIEILAPYCNTGESDTNHALYDVHHASGVTRVEVNQGDNLGEWVSLGSFDLLAGSSNFVYLTDITSSGVNDGVWFDAIRLRFLGATATAANDSPVDGTLFNQRSIQFDWTVSNPGAIQQLHLEVATDTTFDTLVVDQSLNTAATSYTHLFDQDYQLLYWRVRLVNNDSSISSSAPTSFSIDATAPTASVTRIVAQTNGHYVVEWVSEDAGSGVVAISVEYQVAGAGGWQALTVPAGANAALFIPPTSEIYAFRTMATDAAGNVEPAGGSEATTADAVTFNHTSSLPMIPNE